MDFALSAEQHQFQRNLRKFLTERSPSAIVRPIVETERGFDPALWSAMSDELGLAGLLVPEEFGGSGASLVEAVLTMEELGRALVPSPYLATTALGLVPILTLATQEQKQQLLPALASGDRTATSAMLEPDGRSGIERRGIVVSAGDSGVLLTGSRARVIDGHSADLIFVAASAPGSDDVGVYLVDAGAPGLTRTRDETLDLTRAMATLRFDATPATLLGRTVSVAKLSSIQDVALTLLAAEMVGGMEAAMTMSVDYAKTRHQFNRPIGSFQTIKHRCAEMAVELDAARAVTCFAALAGAEGSDEFAVAAPLAKATAAAGFTFAASWNIQIHGGIGFTWEHDAHLYYRKAKADEILFGNASQTWLTVADRVGL